MHYACMHNFYCTNNVGSPVQTHYLHRTRLQPVVCIWDTALVFVFSSFQVQTQSVITSHPTEPSIEIFLSVFLVDKSGANLPNNTLVCLQLENWHLKVQPIQQTNIGHSMTVQEKLRGSYRLCIEYSGRIVDKQINVCFFNTVLGILILQLPCFFLLSFVPEPMETQQRIPFFCVFITTYWILLLENGINQINNNHISLITTTITNVCNMGVKCDTSRNGPQLWFDLSNTNCLTFIFGVYFKFMWR